MDLDALGQCFDMISPFQGTHQPAITVRLGNLHHLAGERLVILGFQSQGSDRVEPVGIKAGTEQDQLGLDPCSKILQLVLEPGEVILPARSHRHREISRGPKSGTLTCFLLFTTPRVKRPAVNGEETDLFVSPEDILGAVTVVDIPVNDQHAVQAVTVDGDLGSQGDVIEQAESHATVGQGMVAGRTHQAECPVLFTVDHLCNRIGYRTGSQARDIPGLFAGNRIRVDNPSSLASDLLETLQVLCAMDRFELIDGEWFPAFGPAAFGRFGVLQHRMDRAQSFRRFRMVACLVVKKPVVVVE